MNFAQNTFAERRQIHDTSFIANEIVYLMLKGKENDVLCKLDIEKAYDHIN